MIATYYSYNWVFNFSVSCDREYLSCKDLKEKILYSRMFNTKRIW